MSRVSAFHQASACLQNAALIATPVSQRYVIIIQRHPGWNDGSGARGWRLDCSIGEPYVIAATAEAGQRIPTSVLVHDILDHHLCDVDIGGHRNEAVALIQLQKRTGSDPLPDFTQIINEDLMHGRVVPFYQTI